MSKEGIESYIQHLNFYCRMKIHSFIALKRSTKTHSMESSTVTTCIYNVYRFIYYVYRRELYIIGMHCE